MALIQQAFTAQMLYQVGLLNKRHVVGVAVGYKNRQGETTGDPAVVVLVEEKVPLSTLTPDDLVPPELEGMRTDVYPVGRLMAQGVAGPRTRVRPVPPGVSIGHTGVTAGTLGALVRDRASGELLLLSNNHVFANSNFANVGDSILQPGPADGGSATNDVVGTLLRFQKLFYLEDQAQATPAPPVSTPPVPGGGTSPVPNPGANPTPRPSPNPGGTSGCTVADGFAGVGNAVAALLGSSKRVQAITLETAQALRAQAVSYAAQAVAAVTPVTNTPEARLAAQSASQFDNPADCAVARPLDANAFTPEIRGIGGVKGVKAPELGMRLTKSGRTTDITEGNVVLLNATVNVGYATPQGNRTARLVGQIITQGMSQSGDSGSLLVDRRDNTAVALLFAGSAQASIGTPIQRVLDLLNVDLVTA